MNFISLGVLPGQGACRICICWCRNLTVQTTSHQMPADLKTEQTSKPHWEINSLAHVCMHVYVCVRECSYKQLGGEISESPLYSWGKWNVGWEELRQGPLESRCSCFSARTYRVLLVLVRKARVSTACPGLHQRWPRAEASLS